MTPYDLICLSHLRWDFVFQRPQHLMTRCAQARRVFFFEEPEWRDDLEQPTLSLSERPDNVFVALPQLPKSLLGSDVSESLRALLDGMIAEQRIESFVLWFYTPMALGFADHLKPLATIYDCMDELSAFKNAPQVLRDREALLFERASVVFTGGQSLYEAKCKQHPNVHAFPSSVDVPHFRQARRIEAQPADQAAIARPRFGFYGVVDERFDIELLREMAKLRPDWQFVIIGPVVKIDPTDLPTAANIHYLGQKKYDELPAYLGGWDAALLLFARNESTRYISPTKTPEYLAGGRPVVSTSIRDVVRPYEALGLVRIADDAEAFVDAIEQALAEDRDVLLEKADVFLSQTSWDHTWSRMAALIDEAVENAGSPTGTGGRAAGRPPLTESEGVAEYV